jgi:cell fate (sporulation/competence/biofilm development) regulator YlbF (YheA/YmcA/DUF963 family)
MEEILKKANELGKMLRETEVYSQYEKLSADLEADQDSRGLMDEYLNLFEEMHKKELSGGAIEVHEKEKLAEVQKRVSENHLIVEYIDAKNRYVNLLMEIQKSVSGEDLTI